jgi:hypothetical protein
VSLLRPPYTLHAEMPGDAGDRPLQSLSGFTRLSSECAEDANPSRTTWLYPLTPIVYCLALSVSSM